MTIDPADAVGHAEYEGKTYYFCSDSCLTQFRADPAQFVEPGRILRLHAWLSEAACTHVAMESTGVYWQPVFNLLEGSFGVVLASAHHVMAVPSLPR